MPRIPPLITLWLLPATLAALLVLAPTLLGHVDHLHMGHPTPDFYDHVFLFHEMGAMLRGEVPLLWTHRISGPLGGDVVLPDPFGALLYQSVLPLLPPNRAWNFSLVSAQAAGAFAGAILAGWAGAPIAGRILGGVLYGGSAYVWAQLHNGETETLHLDILAVTVIAALWWDRRRRAHLSQWQPALLAGVCLGVACLASWYYCAFLCLLAAGGLLWWVMDVRRGGARPDLAPLAAAIGVATLLLFPQIFALARALASSHTLFRMPDILTVLSTDLGALASSSADPANLLDQGPLSSHFGYLHGGYVGPFALSLSAAIWVVDKRSRVWFSLAILAWILALGPLLIVGGEVVHVFGIPVSLPYHLLAEGIPYFSSMRLPYRFEVLTHLFLGVGVALGLGRLLPRLAHSHMAGVCLATVALLDVAWGSGLPLPPHGVEIPPHPAPPGLIQAGEGVLDLPLRVGREDLRGEYLAQLRDHPGWTPYSLMGTQLSGLLVDCPLVLWLAAADPYFEEEVIKAPPGSPLARFGSRLEDNLPHRSDVLTEPLATLSRKMLKEGGVRWVVIHTRHLDTLTMDRWRVTLEATLGPPRISSDEVELYEVR